jgi:hypothetical protein
MGDNQPKKRQAIWVDLMYAAIFILYFVFFYIEPIRDVETFDILAPFVCAIISAALSFHAHWQIRYEKENNEFFHLDRRRVLTLYGAKWLGALCSVVLGFLFLLRLLGLS